MKHQIRPLLALLLALTLYTTLALANTAQVRFVPELSRSPFSDAYSKALSPNENTLTVITTPDFESQTQTFQLNGLSTDGTMYEVRVCWPANYPLEFDLKFDSKTNSVKVAYFSDYYSSDDDLNYLPLDAEFQVVLNKVVLGALPEDIFGAVILAVVGGGLAYFLGGVVYKVVFDSHVTTEKKNR
ncbi:hypothetical protein B0I72DRAFT_40848 [Yarrowia lipolytica]|jgi:hypothetical protein|uniref:YALI0E07337p n=2 Tax=Yarrowia lipolytica TaxID=4952 RepID=Q6C6Q1_YARLI|nr:YALI0E07337p [Yarrowia lipolytica CLIB122]AOW05075.1 hypothetical protein YALI1_E08725g [Yarrowia lipolytica]KAB8286112.1 hypothetical protein BKA91DRAFT_13694 [Yarrowia lipolytica]KAE8171376.1 hypothetical protein BKA90DRAFT_26787 [Yarrowia lipolytica]KAJ8056637.1 hypothetical protein LXG23DRAFT_33531 [Yarrowia lipolytica]QNP98844.1 Hypothetical protein YALI2_E00160g [Yarrowia lipolytica]|eukprot:XP_503661.1 YALI0E07337p [Yarrowia lipolytica CLIB122]